MWASKLSTQLQHFCIYIPVLIHQKRKQPCKALIYDGLSSQ